MSSWQTPLHLGKDCVFHERSGAPQHTCNLYVSTMVFKEDKAVIINIMQLKGFQAISLYTASKKCAYLDISCFWAVSVTLRCVVNFNGFPD